MAEPLPEDYDPIQTGENGEVNSMYIPRDVFTKLLELYPKTKARLQEVCFLKREIMLHYTEKNEQL